LWPEESTHQQGKTLFKDHAWSEKHMALAMETYGAGHAVQASGLGKVG
jgi:hypothetical protein